MKERPITFSATMVRVIDRKTNTRRTRGLDYYNADPDAWTVEAAAIRSDGLWRFVPRHGNAGVVRCPYGVPGDRLWVRETFCELIDDDAPHAVRVYYNATHEGELNLSDGDGFLTYRKDGKPRSPWKSPRFMPRNLSRITLEITDVRVQRLQEISEEDALAEGVERNAHGDGSWTPDDGWLDYENMAKGGDGFPAETAKDSFRSLWESINGAGSWDANPWIWALTFKRVDQVAG